MGFEQALQLFLSILFLPVLSTAFFFAWGAEDAIWLMTVKRVFLMLPVCAVIIGYWTTIVGLILMLFRSDRRRFVTSILVTWWDLGRAIISLWGSIFKFFFHLVVALMSFFRLVVVGFWLTFQDIFLSPLYVVRNLGQGVLNPDVPWLAVALTLFWGVLEAVIFTFVMTPLTIDTLSNMTGTQLSMALVRPPLFFFMLFIVLGSYSVLASWSQAVASRNIGAIIKITVIELVAMFIEIIFLYREFVDALVPWFAQHSGGEANFGIATILIIAGATWLGIRALTWFLFASSGTPTLMAIIQGTGVGKDRSPEGHPMRGSFSLIGKLIKQMQEESAWIRKYGDELLSSFLLPPLNVLACGINFLTILVNSHHLFEVPFKSLGDLKAGRELLKQLPVEKV